MGVHNLWEILDPVAKKCPLAHLEGKKVAVDLSIWIVQSVGLNKSKRPHLRDLFFRVKHMLINNVQPIFVLDGKPPKIKENTIKERNVAVFSKYHDKEYDGGSGSRENFRVYSRECEELLNILGVPCLQSSGEAESFCAYLNANGIVDGCITDDSDAFLYGAETVFRDFKISSQDQEITEYTLSNIKDKHSINREKMIALALLLGCDYTKGISGIGKETALGMLQEMGDIEILQRFNDYKVKSELELFPNYNRALEETNISHCARCGHSGTKTVHQQAGCITCHRESGCFRKKNPKCSCDWHKNQAERNKIRNELKVYEKVKNTPDFPDKKVIDEYLTCHDEIPSQDQLEWHCPNLKSFLIKSSEWFRWTEEECIEKALPIVTSWQITQICQKDSPNTEDFAYTPIQIIKKHVKCGKHFFQVSWKEKDGDSNVENLTSENKDSFSNAYPDIVRHYNSINQKKGKRRLSSPSKCRGTPPDLAKNAKMADFFQVKKKQPVETSEVDRKSKIEILD